MSIAAVLSHLRAAAAAHRKDTANTPIRFTVHAIDEMRKDDIVVDDVVRAFAAPSPQTVRESPNGAGRWEVHGRTIDKRDFTVIVVLGRRPNTIVVTVYEKG